MAKKQGKSEVKITVRHRPDAEWLTYDICKHYMKLAEKITDRSICDSEFGRLCEELMERCDITETQAINILNGRHINDYVAIYNRMKTLPEISQKETEEKKGYLEWLAKKEEEDNQPDEYSLTEND